MARILTFQTDEGLVRLKVDGEPTNTGTVATGPRPKGGYTPASDAESPAGRFEDAFDDLRVYANALAAKIGEIDMKPSEVEVSLGLKLTTQAGIIFASAGADAEMSVTLSWKNIDRDRAGDA